LRHKRAQSGFFGFDVNRTPSEALRRLGVVFQARTLDLDLTVLQNLSYHALCTECPRKKQSFAPGLSWTKSL